MPFTRRPALVLLTLAATVLMQACASSALADHPPSRSKGGSGSGSTGASSKSNGSSASMSAMRDAPLPAPSGPKRSVAVAGFEANGAFRQLEGLTAAGAGPAVMLATELAEYGEHFLVVERAELSQVLAEHQLKNAGVVNPETGPQLGRLIGANYLAFIAITELEEEKSGGLNIGVSGLGSRRTPIGGGLGLRKQKTTLALDVRFVDTETGALRSLAASRTIERSAIDGSLNVRGVSVGGDEFKNSRLGVALRECLADVVRQFAVAVSDEPWRGRVVSADPNTEEVFINAGENSGVRGGDRFEIHRVIEELRDPASGELLGRRTQHIGTVVIDRVDKRFASGRYQLIEQVAPQRDDQVIAAGR